MRYAWLFALVAACGNGSPKNSCPALGPAPGPLCTAALPACGDGIFDNCWEETLGIDGPCPFYRQHVEQCDGSDVPSCASFGKGPGTVSCDYSCTANTNACGACGTDSRVTTCMVAPLTGGFRLAASDPAAAGGPYFAIAASNHGVNDGFEVLRQEAKGFSQHGEQGAANSVDAIAPLVDGWLLAGTNPSHQVTVSRIDLLDTTITDQVIATPASPGVVSIAYGPGGHALVAWVEYVTDASNVMHPQTSFAVVDATGAVIVAPAILFASTADAAGTSVTTDGTSFFVAASGRLARITSAGTVAATLTGFPAITDPLSRTAPVVGWGTSSGWFAAQPASGQMWSAQVFDATGATVGSAIATPALASTPVTLGNDLVIAAAGAQTGPGTVALSVERITPAGIVTTVPMSDAQSTGFAADTVIAPFGGGVAVVFQTLAGPVLALVSL